MGSVLVPIARSFGEVSGISEARLRKGEPMGFVMGLSARGVTGSRDFSLPRLLGGPRLVLVLGARGFCGSAALRTIAADPSLQKARRLIHAAGLRKPDGPVPPTVCPACTSPSPRMNWPPTRATPISIALFSQR